MENRIVGNVLEKNIHFLSRHLILSPTVLQKLRDCDVISESLRRQLSFKDTDEQVPFLIQSINGQGLLTFKRFLAVLRETGHGWMVDKLLSTQALSYEEVQTGGQYGPGYGNELVRERSRLHGMTPEDAKVRLTSAHLRGRAGIDARYGDSGVGGGIGGTYGDLGIGGRIADRYGDSGIGGRGLDGYGGYGGTGEIGLPGVAGTRYGSQGLLGREGTFGGGIGDRYGLPGERMGASRELQFRRALESRRNIGGSAKYRGQVLPAAMFGDVAQPRGMMPSSTYGGNQVGDVTGALVNLHDHFRTQSDTNEQNLTTLKREEQAIKELLDQNVREQSRVRRNQHSLGDIGRRLEEINLKANDVYDPITHSHLSRYRLNQLNQIPWSSDKLA